MAAEHPEAFPGQAEPLSPRLRLRRQLPLQQLFLRLLGGDADGRDTQADLQEQV